MITIFLINTFLFLFITIFKVYYLSRYFNLGLLNPISIPFIIYFPVNLLGVFAGPMLILESGIFNSYFQNALFVTNLSLFILFGVTVYTLNFSRRNKFINQLDVKLIRVYRLRKSRMIILSIFLFIMFLLFFTLLTRDFGFLNWLKDPRTGYQFFRVGNGHWYALSLLCLSTSYAFMSLYMKKLPSLILVFLFYSFIVFFFGSKGFILSYAIFFLNLLWFRRSKKLRLFLFTIPVVAFSLMLINFNPSSLLSIFSYFDHYVNSAMYFEAYNNSKIDLFYGKIWLTDFYKYVPRSIYPDKPFVYGVIHVNELFFPGAAENTHTPVFGGPIALFADFGYIGVLLGSLFNISVVMEAVLMYSLYKNTDFKMIRSNSSRAFLFLWLLAPAFLVFFGTLYSLIILMLLLTLVIFFNRIVL